MFKNRQKFLNSQNPIQESVFQKSVAEKGLFKGVSLYLVLPMLLMASLLTAQPGAIKPGVKGPGINRLARLMSLCETGNNYPECFKGTLEFPDEPGKNSDSLIQSLIIFFEASHENLVDKKSLDTWLPGWITILNKLKKLVPEHPTLYTLQMNLASYYSRQGNPDKALKEYEGLIKEFAGNTRYGSEALFYSAQLHYQKGEYTRALNKYLEIKTIVFLPVSTEEWNQRLAECRFRIMEASIKKGDFKTGSAQLDKVLNSGVQGEFRDSILFHYSEIKMVQKDTTGACSMLKEIVNHNPPRSLTYSSVYNMFLFECPVLKVAEGPAPGYTVLAKRFLTSDEDGLKKKFVLFRQAEYILENQDALSLKQILEHPFLTQMDLNETRNLLVLLLRNAEDVKLQNTLIDWTRNRSGDMVKKDSLLHSVSILYTEYYKFKQGKPFDVTRLPPLDDKWENQIALFLKGAWFASQSTRDSARGLDYIDSVQHYFTLLGRGNSELAFSGALELAKYYTWIIKSMESRSKDPYIKIGRAMIQIKFAIRIARLQRKVEEWKVNLKSVALDRETRMLEIPGTQPENLPGYWNTISVALAGVEPRAGSRRTEAAYDLLVARLFDLYESEKNFHPQSVTSLLTAILVWQQFKVSGSDKAKGFDHQAFAINRLYNLFRNLEYNPDTLFLSQLGGLFKNSTDLSTPTECYYFTAESGAINCLPVVGELPTVASVQDQLLNVKSGKKIDPRQALKIRENLAHYRILCEKQKIRALKSELMNL